MRVRPVLDTNDIPCVTVTPNSAILFDEGNGSRNKLKRYVYDHVFDDTMSQELVYQKTTAALVKDVLNGFSAAVFAYGATGSGEFIASIIQCYFLTLGFQRFFFVGKYETFETKPSIIRE